MAKPQTTTARGAAGRGGAGGGRPAGAKPQAAKAPVKVRPEADGYIPFGQRLAAWWHGEPAGARIVRGASDRQIDIAVDSEPVDTSRWSDLGINISGRLWGPGFSEPGGTAYWDEILIPAGPNGAMTILALCPGLCGGLRHMVKRFDLWLKALEDEPGLLRAAIELNDQAGLHQRILLEKVDFGTFELPDKSHDLIFAREAFFRIAEKPRLLTRATGSLKPGGHLVFTDLVVETADRGAPEIGAWTEAEPAGQFTWSEGQYRQALDAARMEVHVLKDDTEHFNELILQGWQSLQESLVQDPNVSRTFVDVLMREAQIWLTRSRAMEAGKLRLIRVHARRKKLRRTSQQ